MPPTQRQTYNATADQLKNALHTNGVLILLLSIAIYDATNTPLRLYLSLCIGGCCWHVEKQIRQLHRIYQTIIRLPEE